jgi:vacuolar-type H+-ATPase subunit I/STV1
VHTISLVTICKDCSDTFSETLDSLIQNIPYLLDYVIFEGDSISSVKNKVMDHQIFQSQKVKYFREIDNGLYDALNKAINKTTQLQQRKLKEELTLEITGNINTGFNNYGYKKIEYDYSLSSQAPQIDLEDDFLEDLEEDFYS